MYLVVVYDQKQNQVLRNYVSYPTVMYGQLLHKI